MSSRWFDRKYTAWIAVLAILALPSLIPPAPATVDGPSHSYNARVAHGVRHGEEPFASVHTVEAAGIHVSATVLEWLGPRIGWAVAEKLWMFAVMVALLASIAAYARPRGLEPLLLIWFPLGWSVAMGFFDFTLSVALLVAALAAERSRRTSIAAALLLATAIAHPFGSAAAAAILTARAVLDGGSRPLAAVAVLIALGAVLLTPGASGGIDWSRFDLTQRLLTLAFSASLLSVDPLALPVGLLWTALIMVGALAGVRDARLGLVVLLGALLLPTRIGEGSLIHNRGNLIGLLVLSPVALRALREIRPAPRTLAMMLSGVLALATSWNWMQLARTISTEQQDVAAAVEELTDGPVRIASDVDLPLLGDGWRIPVRHHFADRIAVEVGGVRAENYQADHRVFPVKWRRDSVGAGASDARLAERFAEVRIQFAPLDGSVVDRSRSTRTGPYLVSVVDRAAGGGAAPR